MKDTKTLMTEIHASLAKTDNLDPELREKLVAIDQEIQRLLEKDAENTFAYAALQESVRGLAIQFAQKHPNVALLIRQLADMLSKMGV